MLELMWMQREVIVLEELMSLGESVGALRGSMGLRKVCGVYVDVWGAKLWFFKREM